MLKVVFTGGGTGGHFYPLIAVAEDLDRACAQRNVPSPKKFYFSKNPYDQKALDAVGMKYVYAPSAKLNRMTDVKSRIDNVVNCIQLAVGCVQTLFAMFLVYPDVIFSKGGYAAFPAVFAGRILRIPVIIHESDTEFGRVNKFAAPFAAYIGVGFEETLEALSPKEKEKAAVVGVPMRKALLRNPDIDGFDILKLDKKKKTILILGGSLGSQFINETILDALPKLIAKYQIVHQVGDAHFANLQRIVRSSFANNQLIDNYHMTPFLSAYHMRAALSIADVVICRAGATTLAEVSEWRIPAIVIPIPSQVSHDQKKNAYAFAHATGAVVMEQNNLSPNLFFHHIESLMENTTVRNQMQAYMEKNSQKNAAVTMAEAIADILKLHA